MHSELWVLLTLIKPPRGWYIRAWEFYHRNKWFVAIAGFVASYIPGSGFRLKDLEMKRCPEALRPLVNNMYHFSYAWGVFLTLGWGWRQILGWLDKKYGRVPIAHAV